jgi:hypothetical protein
MEKGTKPTKMYACGKIVKKKHHGFRRLEKPFSG